MGKGIAAGGHGRCLGDGVQRPLGGVGGGGGGARARRARPRRRGRSIVARPYRLVSPAWPRRRHIRRRSEPTAPPCRPLSERGSGRGATVACGLPSRRHRQRPRPSPCHRFLHRCGGRCGPACRDTRALERKCAACRCAEMVASPPPRRGVGCLSTKYPEPANNWPERVICRSRLAVSECMQSTSHHQSQSLRFKARLRSICCSGISERLQTRCSRSLGSSRAGYLITGVGRLQ